MLALRLSLRHVAVEKVLLLIRCFRAAIKISYMADLMYAVWPLTSVCADIVLWLIQLRLSLRRVAVEMVLFVNDYFLMSPRCHGLDCPLWKHIEKFTC